MDIKRLCLYCMEAECRPDGICPICGSGRLMAQDPFCALHPETILHSRYVIGRVLGQGGFGITYLAYDMKESRKVVLKELFPSAMVRRTRGSSEISVYKENDFFVRCRQRFIDEAKMIYSFRETPEIVDVYHAFVENNTGYYSMEFLDGETLQAKLSREKRRMTWEELLPVTESMGAALRAVHRKGSIHRDISPENVFLLRSGSVKLIDFGAARHYGNSNGYTEILKKSYAPYEQYQREGNQGPWTDIYAFAATLYYCLTRKTVPEAMSRLLTDRLKPPSYYGAVLSDAVEQALLRALKVKAEYRFSTIEEFMRALHVDLRPLFPCETENAATNPGGQTAAQWRIRGVYGVYCGQCFLINGTVVLGRDPTKCTLVFPQDSPGISRVHASLFPAENGILCLRRESAGQMLYVNGNPLGGQGSIVPLSPGDRISFGRNQDFVIERFG